MNNNTFFDERDHGNSQLESGIWLSPNLRIGLGYAWHNTEDKSLNSLVASLGAAIPIGAGFKIQFGSLLFFGGDLQGLSLTPYLGLSYSYLFNP